MNIRMQDLIDRDYKRYINKSEDDLCYVASYQKQILDDTTRDIKYFINVTEYNFSAMDADLKECFESLVQMTLRDDITFNIRMIHDKETTIDSMEHFYEDVWVMLPCKKYKE